MTSSYFLPPPPKTGLCECKQKRPTAQILSRSPKRSAQKQDGRVPADDEGTKDLLVPWKGGGDSEAASLPRPLSPTKVTPGLPPSFLSRGIFKTRAKKTHTTPLQPNAGRTRAPLQPHPRPSLQSIWGNSRTLSYPKKALKRQTFRERNKLA